MSVKRDLKKYVEKHLPTWIKTCQSYEPDTPYDADIQEAIIEILQQVKKDLEDILDGNYKFIDEEE